MLDGTSIPHYHVIALKKINASLSGLIPITIMAEVSNVPSRNGTNGVGRLCGIPFSPYLRRGIEAGQ
jgi:hypothetical protein